MQTYTYQTDQDKVKLPKAVSYELYKTKNLNTIMIRNSIEITCPCLTRNSRQDIRTYTNSQTCLKQTNDNLLLSMGELYSKTLQM